VIASSHWQIPGGRPRQLTARRIDAIVKKVLSSEKKSAAGEVHVIFVDRKNIRRLNRQFLDTPGDTDVIAFPYNRHPGASQSRIYHGPGKKRSGGTVEGDIYICLPVAKDNAGRFKQDLERELTRLVVHGTLHLLGYADEPERARKKMWSRQEPLVEKLMGVSK